MAPEEPGDFLLRPGGTDDLPATYDVYTAAVASAGIPEHRPEAEVRAWLATTLGEGRQLWVAERDDEVLAFAATRHDWLFLLFVHPERSGQGTGAALIDLVKSLLPHGFGLRVHTVNERARAFYGRHGLVELEHTDGSSYPDDEPDVKMAWLGDDPMTFLRGRIDDVDDELAVLLARRAALTAAVQEHKEVGGHAGRDPDREQEIVDRMAAHVPSLDPDTLRRIMHAVIGESLAAWERG